MSDRSAHDVAAEGVLGAMTKEVVVAARGTHEEELQCPDEEHLFAWVRPSLPARAPASVPALTRPL